MGLTSGRLETFDFRAQETFYNKTLPQFRTILDASRPGASEDDREELRVHFAHRRSSHQDAVPLLVCHDWGSSFLEVARAVDALCEPNAELSPGSVPAQAFHLVCPSIPGFGYSDASTREDFGLDDTARVFQSLMVRLGYQRFVVFGSGW